MLLLGLDFETTGVDPKTDAVTEIGAVLYDWETKTPVAMQSDIVQPVFKEQTDEAARVSGLTPALIQRWGIMPDLAFHKLEFLAAQCDAVVAHNGGQFDKLFCQEYSKRYTIPNVMERLWLDTYTDVPYPEHFGTRRLGYLAAEHGFLNPFPHRAVFDVLTMLKVLGHYDLAQVIAIAKQPMVTLQALVAFEHKDKARNLGYHWKPEVKQWRKVVKEGRLTREIADAEKENFKTVVVNDGRAQAAY